MKSMSKRWLLAAAFTIVAVAAVVGSQALDGSGGDALAGPTKASVRAGGLGPISGLLPRDHLTEESAIQVDLSKESVRLPLYKGKAERPDGVVHAPRRLRSGDRPRSRRQLRAQARQHRHRLPRLRADGDARLTLARPEQVRTGGRQLPGRARLQPDPDRHPRPRRLPAGEVPARRRGGQRLQPVHPDRRLADRLQRPIVATGDGPFDVVHHTDTGDRVLGIHIAGPSAPGQYAESWVDLLFVKGFDAGQPIVYISTDAGQPLTSVLERSTLRPGPRQGGLQRRRRLPRLRPRAAVRLHQRPDRRQQQGVTGVRAPGQRRPRLRGRQRRQHGADRRAAPRR